MPVTKTEQLKVKRFEDVAEVISTAPEVVASAALPVSGNIPKETMPEEGRIVEDRVTPTTKSLKRMAIQITTHEASSVSNDESRPAPRSYDNDFAERAERTERPEPQANIPSR